jgi:hypothetical protein
MAVHAAHMPLDLSSLDGPETELDRFDSVLPNMVSPLPGMLSFVEI